MSSILSQIQELNQVHRIHEDYARAALKLIITKILNMSELDIGVFSNEKERGSIIAFDGDDFENINIELCYAYPKFILNIRENGDELDISIFSYKILEHSNLYQMIPENLIKAMEESADGDDSITIRLW